MSQQIPPGYPMESEASNEATEFVDAQLPENLTIAIDPDLQPERNITFHVTQEQSEEMLRITEDGFYVRGKKVADDREVYHAFIEWLNITNQGIGQPLLEDVLKPKKKMVGFNRFDSIRETGVKMDEETERKIREYRQAGHQVIRSKQVINGELKNVAEIQLDIFGKKTPEEIEKGVNC